MKIPTLSTLTRRQELQLIEFAIQALVLQALNSATPTTRNPQQHPQTAATRKKISAAMQRRWKVTRANGETPAVGLPTPGKRRRFATREEARVARLAAAAHRRALARAAKVAKAAKRAAK